MEKEFVCQFCSKVSPTIQSHCNHEKYCKLNPQQNKRKGRVLRKELCPHCGQYFNAGKKYEKHVNACRQRKVKRNYGVKITSEQQLQEWVSQEHVCEYCGKIMTSFYGTGRFCSPSCARSFCQTFVDYSVVSQSLLHHFELLGKTEHSRVRSKEEKFCIRCGKQLRYDNKSGYCGDCIKSAPERSQIRIQAGKKGIETKRKNGTLVGWQKRNVQSYSESFWQRVLDNNHIDYRGPNYPVKKRDRKNNYFLDFFIEVGDKKIDLEIDGKQHKYPDRAQKDKIRDEYLTSIGFIVYRIDWNEIKSEVGKQLMQEKIDRFLNFLLDKK